MPRVRSRRALASRDPLAGVPLMAELQAREHPYAFPEINAAILAAEQRQPNSLCALLCRMAVERAEGDPQGALAKLARARRFRALTPVGGFASGPRTSYLEHSTTEAPE